jgi:pyridoxal phosphate enzyme (YggS family)
MYEHIRDNVRRLLAEIPPQVTVIAAAKSRTYDEVAAAIDAGISIIGENYVHEAESARGALTSRGEWHFIGHLQLNKVKKAVELFSIIETIDSLELAAAIDRNAAAVEKVMPVFIEVNIGREPQKNGAIPESVPDLARSIALLPNLRLSGLMTMGPKLPPEELRPFFAEANRLYENLKCSGLPGADIRYLSMGMSDSYKVAIEEGANMVRLGTAIFGQRP